MEEKLATEQALKYAAGLRELYAPERGQFDPDLVDPFLELLSRRQAA